MFLRVVANLICCRANETFFIETFQKVSFFRQKMCVFIFPALCDKLVLMYLFRMLSPRIS